MLDYLSDQDKILGSVGLVALFLIALYYYSQDAWLFAISILTVWPFADKLYKRLKAQESTHPIGFLVYTGIIIGVSAAADYVSQQIKSPFRLPSSSENVTSSLAGNVTTFLNSTFTLSSSAQNSNFHSIGYWTVGGLSLLASAFAYLVSNWSELKELNARHGWIK